MSAPTSVAGPGPATTLDVEVVRRYNAALLSAVLLGDAAAVRRAVAAYLSPDAVCHETPALPWGGTFTGGADGIAALFSAGAAAMVSFAVEHGVAITAGALEDDEYAVGVDSAVVIRRTTMTFPATDQHAELVVPVLDRYLLDDGLITRIDVHFFDVPAMVERLVPAA